MESESILTPRERSLYQRNPPQRRFEPTKLYQAEQRAQHTTNELFRPLGYINVLDPGEVQILIRCARNDELGFTTHEVCPSSRELQTEQPFTLSPGVTRPLCFSLQIAAPGVCGAAWLSLSWWVPGQGFTHGTGHWLLEGVSNPFPAPLGDLIFCLLLLGLFPEFSVDESEDLCKSSMESQSLVSIGELMSCQQMWIYHVATLS